MQKLKVFKFGGASIRDAAAIRKVATILDNYREDSLVIVVSAMGKTTNALEKVVQSYYEQDGKAFEHFNAVKHTHYQVMLELFPEDHDIFAQINDTFIEIEWVIEEEPQDTFDYLYDQIVSIGEMVSSKLVAAYLQEKDLPTQWLDARDAILTDNTYREGRVEWTETQERMAEEVLPKLAQKGFVLTQGFIGGTSENFTTTLGREGSDFTAAIFSYCLNATSMCIWKDVPGVLTGDPRIFDNVSKIDHLSYKEAIEMTYYGAKVIHPKTIKPLQNKNIPLQVRSFVEPDREGTLISEDSEGPYPPVVVVEKDQVMMQITTRDFSFVAEHHISHLFTLLSKYRIKVNMMQNMAISFSLCVTNRPERLKKLCQELEADFNVKVQDQLELITIRHYNDALIDELIADKMILLEERIRGTVQFVAKAIPLMHRKEG